MKKSIRVIALMALLLSVTLAGCTPQQGGGSSGFQAIELNPSDMADVSPYESAYDILTAYGGTPTKVGYMDSESVWRDAYWSDTHFRTDDKTILEEFGAILSGIGLEEDTMEMWTFGVPELPVEGEYMFFELLMDYGGHTNTEYLAAQPDGTMYFGLRNLELDEYDFIGVRMADATQYATLRTELEKLIGKVYGTLESAVDIYASPQRFRPESTALRLNVVNKGLVPVSFGRAFTFEKRGGDDWQPVTYSLPTTHDLVVVAPGESLTFSVDLSGFDGGLAEGDYRAGNMFHTEQEDQQLSAGFSVSADSSDLSNPPVPAMSAENQAYYDQYLSAWGFYSPFDMDFSQQAYFTDYNPYLLYYGCAAQEGVSWQYRESYFDDVPASVVEQTVTDHFLISVEVFREKLRKPAEAGAESAYYDPELDAYHFPGGYGGGSLHGSVTSAAQDGNLLTLTCEWYNMDDSFAYSHTVTIRLGEEKKDFVYVSNKVNETAGE